MPLNFMVALSRLFPEVKVVNTFINVDSQDPDAFVERGTASCPPTIFNKNINKNINSNETTISTTTTTSSKQQQYQQQQQRKEAVRTEANQGGVASAGHVGLESPSRWSIQRKKHQQRHKQQQLTQQQKLQAHQSGQCRPCSFHNARADSCRLGDDCQFCHLCTYEDLMQKKNASKHDRRTRLRGEKRLNAQSGKQQDIAISDVA
ncbi:unnamed protein product [Polarella glacialis]|uniref:C3H1-type domain-containing protein n=1 Tax=Polarella glacialis TaxID=89957 RepID=A0A813GT33_POLGL|nr:unnamed protein product [Polarella glacialis]